MTTKPDLCEDKVQSAFTAVKEAKVMIVHAMHALSDQDEDEFLGTDKKEITYKTDDLRTAWRELRSGHDRLLGVLNWMIRDLLEPKKETNENNKV